MSRSIYTYVNAGPDKHIFSVPGAFDIDEELHVIPLTSFAGKQVALLLVSQGVINQQDTEELRAKYDIPPDLVARANQCIEAALAGLKEKA